MASSSIVIKSQFSPCGALEVELSLLELLEHSSSLTESNKDVAAMKLPSVMKIGLGFIKGNGVPGLSVPYLALQGNVEHNVSWCKGEGSSSSNTSSSSELSIVFSPEDEDASFSFIG